MPKSEPPALLETTVRFFVPARRTAAIRFSGIPQRPKPPIRMVAPSRRPSIAASAPLTRLSMRPPKNFASEDSLLQIAENLVNLVGGGEFALELALAEIGAEMLDGLREP